MSIRWAFVPDVGRVLTFGPAGVAALLIVCALGAVADAAVPLVDAARQGDVAAVRAQLQRTRDANVAEPDGTTALHWAAQRGNRELAELLLRAGADAKRATRYGVTPLSLASQRGSAPVVTVLLAAGADPNTSLPGGETARMTAARAGAVDVMQLLLARGAKANAKDDTAGQTALMWAAAEGHAPAVKALVAGGAEVSARSTGGWTPLMFAVREGHVTAVQALLDAGASVNDTLMVTRPNRPGLPGGSNTPVPGSSALVVAVANAHFELAAYLLDKGANPNAAAQGWTALHQITWVRKPGQGSTGPGPAGSGSLSSLELVRKLIEKGADPNARMTGRAQVGVTALNMIGATPFLMEARSADAPLKRLLASLGDDPRLANQDDTTPLMVAAGVGTHSPGEDPGSEAEVLEAVRVALELGNDINAVDKNGNTAMHGAALKQVKSVVSFLSTHGADITVWNQKNRQGWTPLRIAAGVFRGGMFRFSDPTADRVREVMTAAGVSTMLDDEAVNEIVGGR
jgi:ankyrin repeat protein